MLLHSHNDYEQQEPLHQAIDASAASIEVDIAFRRKSFLVTHGFLSPVVGELSDLYLSRLNERPPSLNLLWLDLKDTDEGAAEALDRLLANSPAVGSSELHSSLRVIFTGDERVKKQMVRLRPSRWERDSNDFSLLDMPGEVGWTAYALDWWTYVGGGHEAPQRISCLVHEAKRVGRLLRFYGGPDDTASWELQREAGVPLLGTDRLREARDFLSTLR